MTSAYVDPGLPEQRARISDPKKTMYPYSSPLELVVAAGDLVYVTKDSWMGASRNLGGAPDRAAFSSVNGLPIGTELMIVGQSVAQIAPDTETGTRKDFTVVEFGKVSIINHGRMTITPGMRVMFKSTPYVRDNGKERPILMNQLRTGPSTKAMPEIYGLVHSDVAAQAMAIRIYVKNLIKTMGGPESAAWAGDEKPRELLAAVRTWLKTDSLASCDVQPLHLYGEVWAMIAINRHDLVWDLRAEHLSQKTRDIARFEAAARRSVQLAGPMARNRAFALEEQPKKRRRTASRGRVVPKPADKQSLSEQALGYLSDLIPMQYRYIEQHTVGLAISSARPGEVLDVILKLGT